MRYTSLRARLRWLIIGVLVVVLIPLGVLSYQRTINEMVELSDGRLAEAARTIDALVVQAGIQTLKSGDHWRVPVKTKAMSDRDGETHTHEAEVGYQVFDLRGKLLISTANVADLSIPPKRISDFRNMRGDDYTWRIYTLVDEPNGVIIHAAERYDSRHDMTHALLLDHGLQLVIGLPLLALLIGWAVQRGLRPLATLAAALSSREPGSRKAIQLDDAPRELRPVLDALNEQLERQEDALERERRFSADVAHELRTPLASIMINLDSATVTADLAEAHVSLAGARQSAAILARRVEQLLALAKLEAGAASTQRQNIDLVELASSVIEELTSVIADSGVQLEFVLRTRTVVVQGYEAALSALLRNLVENALRQVSKGGHVQLILEQHEHEATVDVLDDGPGIPAEHRAAVFARFHREKHSQGDGYGLGLSIVHRAAQLHDASIQLLDSPFASGLRVRVAIPAVSR